MSEAAIDEVSGTAIDVAHLSKRYGKVAAVEDVTFSVGSGEVFGFLGPNGAGKTTTIRCLLGFIKPSAGEVRILGKPVATEIGAALESVGYVPGEAGFWPWLSGAEALDHLASLHPREPTERRALLERFELSTRDLDRPVRSYSRGMRQKLALVQAFQHRPDLVVLDEPTEGLDPLMQDRFLDLLRSFRAAGGTALMSSHILAEVEAIADRVGIIRKGSLVALGKPEDIAPGRHRHCTATFGRDVGTDEIAAIAGVSRVTALGSRRLRFLFSGEAPGLLQRLSNLELVDIDIEPPKLADIFIGFYEEESA